MLTVSADDLRKELRKLGIGGWMGRGLRLFDQQYALIPYVEMDAMVVSAMNKLDNEGLIPSEDYATDGGDCDNWTLWVQAEVTKSWSLKHQGLSQYPALAFGRCMVPGHDINIGITASGPYVWNYGTVTAWNLKSLTEVEFK